MLASITTSLAELWTLAKAHEPTTVTGWVTLGYLAMTGAGYALKVFAPPGTRAAHLGDMFSAWGADVVKAWQTLQKLIQGGLPPPAGRTRTSVLMGLLVLSLLGCATLHLIGRDVVDCAKQDEAALAMSIGPIASDLAARDWMAAMDAAREDIKEVAVCAAAAWATQDPRAAAWLEHAGVVIVNPPGLPDGGAGGDTQL